MGRQEPESISQGCLAAGTETSHEGTVVLLQFPQGLCHKEDRCPGMGRGEKSVYLVENRKTVMKFLYEHGSQDSIVTQCIGSKADTLNSNLGQIIDPRSPRN